MSRKADNIQAPRASALPFYADNDIAFDIDRFAITLMSDGCRAPAGPRRAMGMPFADFIHVGTVHRCWSVAALIAAKSTHAGCRRARAARWPALVGRDLRAHADEQGRRMGCVPP